MLDSIKILIIILCLFLLFDLMFFLYLMNLKKRLNILSRFLYENGYLDDIDEEFWEE